MKVLKFGGSSVQDAVHIKRVVSIFSSQENVRAVVFSAMKGVTNDLINAARQAERGDEAYKKTILALRRRHEEVLSLIFDDVGTTQIHDRLDHDFTELDSVCHGVFLVRECSVRIMDLIMSFGERWSNQLIHAYAVTQGLDAFYVDARNLLISDNFHGNARIDIPESFRRIREYFLKKQGIGIVTGFIASGPGGIVTTLGRNGSDYSASLFAAALDAHCIEIWTDVDGVLEADPSIVPGAGVIDELSVDEALELSYFGAEILHPSTVRPAIENAIPIWIKNSLNPEARGTRISANPRINSSIITGIATIPRVSLINIIGGGMIGTNGIAAKILSVFSRKEINIIMISQASSEHSICLVIHSQECNSALESLRADLDGELATGVIQDIRNKKDLEVVAVIGANMQGSPGVSGRLFKTLGDEGINIFAIAQGSSEMNISFVISSEDRIRSVQSIHRAFFGSVNEEDII